jgi:hypothetical protein
VGERRCAGQGIHCAELPFFDTQQNSVVPLLRQEIEAEVVWSAVWPCEAARCDEVRSADLVLQADDSMTVARSLIGGVWLARFDSDGHMLWKNTDLLDPDRTEYDADKDTNAKLIVDRDGSVMLATLRAPGHNGELTVYAIAEDGTLGLLFRSAGPTFLSGVALMEDDLVVFGQQSGPDQHTPNAELARYKRDGTLIWRQTSLKTFGGDPALHDLPGFTIGLDFPLVVDRDNHAWLAVVDHTYLPDAGYAVVQVGTDGNVRWVGEEVEGRIASKPSYRAEMVLATDGRVVLGRDQSGYRLDQYAPEGDPAKRIDLLTVSRERDEFWQPDLLGLALDGANRMLVATQSGLRSAPRFIIDRYPADFYLFPESFVVANAAPMIVSKIATNSAFSELDGIRAGRDGDVYFWSETAVGRIALPDSN